eukprot:scaffold182_cov350-Prasinococcus_capsulatus_cf.AAC.21
MALMPTTNHVVRTAYKPGVARDVAPGRLMHRNATRIARPLLLPVSSPPHHSCRRVRVCGSLQSLSPTALPVRSPAAAAADPASQSRSPSPLVGLGALGTSSVLCSSHVAAPPGAVAPGRHSSTRKLLRWVHTKHGWARRGAPAPPRLANSTSLSRRGVSPHQCRPPRRGCCLLALGAPCPVLRQHVATPSHVQRPAQSATHTTSVRKSQPRRQAELTNERARRVVWQHLLQASVLAAKQLRWVHCGEGRRARVLPPPRVAHVAAPRSQPAAWHQLKNVPNLRPAHSTQRAVGFCCCCRGYGGGRSSVSVASEGEW